MNGFVVAAGQQNSFDIPLDVRISIRRGVDIISISSRLNRIEIKLNELLKTCMTLMSLEGVVDHVL